MWESLIDSSVEVPPNLNAFGGHAREVQTMTTPGRCAARHSRLRRRLAQLGYDQHLGEESLRLAECLFRDLVRTTEALGAEREAARLAEEQLQREREQREREDDDEVAEEVEREMNVRRATSDRHHKVGSLAASGGPDVDRVATLLEKTCIRIRDLQGELQRLRAELRRSETRAADLDSQVRFLTVAKEEASSRCEADLRERTAALRRSEACARQQAEKLAAHVETLKGELLESKEQNETLRMRMQDFVTEISHVEGMLGVREEEHSHLLACYGDATFPDSLLTNV
uniref:Centrosomal protein of 135 kDa-like isoform X1 n=2 Tax=Petromyzon marinus TaxID=7757 RepID=A0AAJ7XJU2_PETMA|nr:centrosomal protein of 135 kDa-like isoform X1 [Petromyzon marinus]